MLDALYVHIPFCIKKCAYCDFLSITKYDDKFIDKYISILIKELSLYKNYKYDTIYIGGGTPSAIKPIFIEKILKNINTDYAKEITIECNPYTLKKENLMYYKNLGINRLSIGVQSFQNKFLKQLERLHNENDIYESYNLAREIGFKNINLDLIYALPNQKLGDLKYDLEKIISLRPDHISVYSLSWEENTKFWKLYLQNVINPIENDLESDMYSDTINILKDNGYEHYEISNFSLLNKHSIHNKKYWENKEYLGVGLGSSGYIKNLRYKNITSMKRYIDSVLNNKKPIEEYEIINSKEKNEYYYILGLRLLKEGVKIREEKHKNIMKDLTEKGFLFKIKDKYYLTDKGLFFGNEVFKYFLEDH